MTASDIPIDAAAFTEQTTAIQERIGTVIDGKPEAVRATLVCLLAEGHLLIEDVPGVGKTMLARALAATVDATVRRIQFTPDLLPGDITGVSIFNPVAQSFEFAPGAIFAQIVIADEINRSSPKTQSALLEAMEEGQVTADGHSHPLPTPFFVVATQNPLEMEGTYALPEAQRDRFMMRIRLGYPDTAAETLMLHQRDTANPLAAITPVTDVSRLAALIDYARHVHVSPAVESYAVALAQATRISPVLRLGASPRATLQLVRAAKVCAALEGREFVVPDDLADLVVPVFAHRLLPSQSSRRASIESVEEVLTGIVRTVAVPQPARR